MNNLQSENPPPVSPWLNRLARKTELRAKAGLRRTATPRNTSAIDLAGNDYLGLSQHPAVVGAANATLYVEGLGATGSRVVRGTTDEHIALEVELAAHLGWPAALVYSSGYLANLGAIRGLCRQRSLLVVDAHAHASLLDSCRIAAAETNSQIVTVAHADPTAVGEVLAQHSDRPALVIVESVYSVDGDLAPLTELYQQCQQHGAVLLVDEAHALGVLGEAGTGAVAAAGLAGAPNIVVTATLSKALGAAGGAVAGPVELIEHLTDTSRTFIFDTALPPAVAAGARVALDLLRGADYSRHSLHLRRREAVALLRDSGFVVPEPTAGVISIRASSAKAAARWAEDCRSQGVEVGCFRPPSTPDGLSRLRLTINTGIPGRDFTSALKIIIQTVPETD